MSAAQVVFGALFAASCTYTVVGYPGRYGALSGRSRLFRTVGLFLLNLLLGIVLIGTFVDWRPPSDPGQGRALAFRLLAYTLACVFLALSLLCVAALDWLELQVVLRRSRSDVLRKIAEDELARKAGLLPPNASNSGEAGVDASKAGDDKPPSPPSAPPS